MMEQRGCGGGSRNEVVFLINKRRRMREEYGFNSENQGYYSCHSNFYLEAQW